MTEENEEDRVKKINEKSVVILQDWLKDIEEGTKTHDELVASTYALMITSFLLGYSPEKMVEDAKVASQKLLTLVAEEENELTSEE
jgi:hypothetical protein